MRCAICFSLLLALALPSEGSSLPAVNQPVSRLTLGSAPGLGIDYALDQRSAIGLNLATPFYFGSDFGAMRYSMHGVYQVLNENGFYMGLVAGVYGDLYFPEFSRHPMFAIQAGAALAYDLNRSLSLRLNIVPGISLQIPPDGWVFFPPAGGLELAWKITPQIEASLGFNGNGDILAISWVF